MSVYFLFFFNFWKIPKCEKCLINSNILISRMIWIIFPAMQSQFPTKLNTLITKTTICIKKTANVTLFLIFYKLNNFEGHSYLLSFPWKQPKTTKNKNLNFPRKKRNKNLASKTLQFCRKDGNIVVFWYFKRISRCTYSYT